MSQDNKYNPQGSRPDQKQQQQRPQQQQQKKPFDQTQKPMHQDRDKDRNK